MPPRPSQIRPRTSRPSPVAPALPAASWGAGALAFAVYLALTSHASGDKDGSEFTLVLATLGTAHPTGYPLYTLAGHGFVLLLHALGASWPYAANAFSAVGGAVAIGLMHALAATLARFVGVGSRPAAAVALLPVLAFALNPAWTMECTIAEVNSWQVAWVIGLVLFTLTTASALGSRDTPANERRSAALMGLLVGIGLAHHLTSVWFSVPMVVALGAALAARKRLVRGNIVAGAIGVTFGLSSLGYLAWRAAHPAAVHWPMLTPDTLWDHILGAQYRGYLGHFAPSELQRQLLGAHVYPWLVPALIAVVTFAFLGRSNVPRPWRVGVAAAAVMQTVYVFRYGVPDPSPYFLPVLGVGLATLPGLMADRLPALRRIGVPIGLAVGAMLLVPCTGWMRRAHERSRAFERFDERVHAQWLSVPFEEGFVIWGDDLVHRLTEYQLLRGEKSRVIALNPAQLTYPGPQAAFVARHGFDPLADLPPLPELVNDDAIRALYDAITERINRASALPVAVLDPRLEQVRVLAKPPGAGQRSEP